MISGVLSETKTSPFLLGMIGPDRLYTKNTLRNQTLGPLLPRGGTSGGDVEESIIIKVDREKASKINR